MIKDIKYNGYTSSESDYECQDGDLAISMGMVHEDNHLKPIQAPKVVLDIPQGYTLLYIHKTADYTHYIYKDQSAIYWTQGQNTEFNVIEDKYDIRKVSSIGNTLMLLNDYGISYYLYKDSAYTSLGNHLPDPQLSFCLTGSPKLYSENTKSGKKPFTINFDSISDINQTFTEDNQTKITAQVMAKLNKFVAEESVQAGKFIFPFFVRYAIRLYDGSLVMHSAPILMNPGTTSGPVVLWKRATGSSSYTSAELDILAVPSILSFRWMSTLQCAQTDIDKWKDIIKSIDIFVSKPIYPYDQSGKITSFADSDNLSSTFIGKIYPLLTPKSSNAVCSKTDGTYDYSLYAAEWTYSKLYALFKSTDFTYPGTTVCLPEFDEGKQREEIESTHTFYRIASVPIENLTNYETYIIKSTADLFFLMGLGNIRAVQIEELSSLTAREVMTDDYLSHDQIYADTAYNYNARINLAGIRRNPYRGFTAQAMFGRCERTFAWRTDSGKLYVDLNVLSSDPYKIDVYIKENGRTLKVSSEMDYTDSIYLAPLLKRGDSESAIHGAYLYYPNTNAFAMVIHNGSRPVYYTSLKAHDFLNGAYNYSAYAGRTENASGNIPPYSEPDYTGDIRTINFPISATNKIYTSEVNNPFFFPVTGINTIGSGEVIELSSSAKALSQGQFGQFPLYAFTTEGVWALEVSSTGGYAAKQPITRDVCINAKGITQLDDAVLFPTDRGIMLISGSTAQCISDRISNEESFSISSLPAYDKLIAMYNQLSDGNSMAIDDITIIPFRQFIQDCRMLYDYTHQHIMLFNPSIRYAYVYSMKSHEWGMMRSNLAESINAYPEAMATTSDSKIVDFSQQDEGIVTSLVITRPFKIDGLDTFKTINTIIQRGVFIPNIIRQVIYGSNNLTSWHVVWGSADRDMRGFRGTPYKAYRIAIIAQFASGGSLYGFTADYNLRMTNRIR